MPNRITEGMTSRDAAIALAENNVGALVVVGRMLREGDTAEPAGAPHSGYAAIRTLDRCGIYGERIWHLYKDVCGEDLGLTMALLRAVRIAIVDADDLTQALTEDPSGLRWRDLLDVAAAIRVLESDK